MNSYQRIFFSSMPQLRSLHSILASPSPSRTRCFSLMTGYASFLSSSFSNYTLNPIDSMEINHAPNPHDIIWENVAIPKSQITLRSYITNIGVIIGSIFWSSLVNSVNIFASLLPIPKSQQLYASAVIMLVR